MYSDENKDDHFGREAFADANLLSAILDKALEKQSGTPEQQDQEWRDLAMMASYGDLTTMIAANQGNKSAQARRNAFRALGGLVQSVPYSGEAIADFREKLCDILPAFAVIEMTQKDPTLTSENAQVIAYLRYEGSLLKS